MLGFGFVELLLQISMNRAKFVGEKKVWFGIKPSEESRSKVAQQAQSRQSPRPIPRSKVAQNASFEKCSDRAKQSSPRAARGVHHGPWWGTHGRASRAHGRASPGPFLFVVFCAAVRLPACLWVFNCCFDFKRGMNLALEDIWFIG